jgi:hypothetical protein
MILAAVEGYPDAEAVKKILHHVGLTDSIVLRKRGKGELDAALPELNRSARSIRCLVVRDLDHDADCAANLTRRLVPRPSRNLLFRIAVREIEAWLFGDPERFARFLDVPPSKIPQDPDSIDDPKALVTRLARRSRTRLIREGIPARDGSGIPVGPGYPSLLGQFIRESWSPDQACLASSSLRRCVERLREWQ